MDKCIFSFEDVTPGVINAEFIETVDGLKKVTRHNLSVRDFISILQKSADEGSQLRIGPLPNGFYDGHLSADGNGFHCIIVLEEGIKPFIFYDKTYMIPFPKLVFDITARDGKLVEAFVFAVKSKEVDDRTVLYNYPFGNVYPRGAICWGGNSLSGLYKLRDAETVISTFFGCSTNDDMWVNGENVNVKTDDPRKLQRGLVESLEGKDAFPDKILVSRNTTLSELIK